MNQTRAGPFQERGEWVSFPAIYFRSDRAPEVVSVSASPFGFGAVIAEYQKLVRQQQGSYLVAVWSILQSGNAFYSSAI